MFIYNDVYIDTRASIWTCAPLYRRARPYNYRGAHVNILARHVYILARHVNNWGRANILSCRAKI